jgi:predicted ArsR family transcriptional regulator
MEHGAGAQGGVDALIAALDDPTRRAIYRHVSDAGSEVSRDAAAAAVGVPRGTAAFHLDRLVEAGMLSTVFRRLNDRTGPGAGRPSKMYRTRNESVDLSIPPRRYVLAGRILVSALDSLRGSTAAPAIRRAAVIEGRNAVKDAGVARASTPTLVATLDSLGYEPVTNAAGDIALRNCPFHALVEQSQHLTCALNQAFIEGVLDELGDDVHRADLAPSAGQCCVRLTLEPPPGIVAA